MNYESAQLQLPADDPALAGHFPQSPIASGVWLPAMFERECRARMGS